jgi:hypothetical protein
MNVKESLSLTSMLSKVPTNKSREFYEKIGNAANKNLALIDLVNANPYANKYSNEDYSELTSGRDRKGMKRRSSIVRRVDTAKSSRHKKSETNRSKKGRSRRGSLMSRKSLVTPKARLSHKPTMSKKKSKRSTTSRASLNRNQTTKQVNPIDMINASGMSPEKLNNSKML